MAFCINCGKELTDGAKFCAVCGIKVDSFSTSQVEQRKTVYDGEVHKCPNCGEILDAYESVCEHCGYERRGNTTTASSQAFFAELNAALSEKDKASIIQNFPIPNNKEDIIEFLILASSIINRQTPTLMLNAWKTKIEQCHLKAKLAFESDSKLSVLEELCNKTQKEIARIKRRRIPRWVKISFPIISGIVLFLGVTLGLPLASLNADAKKAVRENERLEIIEEKIEEALDEGDYRYALMNADSLIFDGGDDELERDWKIKRNYWIDRIIEEAAEDGVILERPVDAEISEETIQNFDLTIENSIGSTQYEFKYDNFLEVKKELEERGFSNIKTEGLKDLKADWMSRDGLVEKVTVDGETGFPADIAFPLDVEIVIYYHSLNN